MPRPLDGIRVLDSAHQYPGPYCSMLLSDLGADVIKIERPGTGDPARRMKGFFRSINRGKRSITLNLKHADAQAIFHRLAQTADVVTEGFRPGVARRLRIDYDTLAALNPDLIYCSISGFGQDGPYRDLPGHDLNYLALTSMLQAFKDASGNYIQPKVAIGDLSAGIFAVVGILAALQARATTGTGQYIDVSMFDGLVSWMSTSIGIFHDTARPFRTYDPGYGIFTGSDGEDFTLGIAHEDWFWTRLCDATGLKEFKHLQAAARIERRAELIEQLKAVFRMKTRDEWLAILNTADVPASKIQDAEQISNDPHATHRGLIQDLTLDSGETAKQVAFPVKLSKTPAAMQGPPPELGQHTEMVLKELEYSDEQIAAFRDAAVI